MLGRRIKHKRSGCGGWCRSEHNTAGGVQYKIEGEADFLANRRSHVYSPELKLQAVQEYLSGKGSLAEISKNISCGVELNSEIG